MKIEQVKGIETREEARRFAIDWQRWVSEHNLNYGELADWYEELLKLAFKFDLVDEFKDNGII